MRRCISRLVLIALSGLMFSSAALAAQETRWQELMDSAGKLAQQKHYKDAEKQYKAALREAEAFGKQDPRLAKTLLDFATLYLSQRKFENAAPLCRRALTISESLQSPNDPKLISLVGRLADIERLVGKPDKAELLYQRAVDMTEKAFGAEHLEVAGVLDYLAMFYYFEGILPEEALLGNRVTVDMFTMPSGMPVSSVVIINYYSGNPYGSDFPLIMPGTILTARTRLGKKELNYLKQAEAHFKRALEIREKAFGPNDLQIADTLTNMGFVDVPLKRFDEAESHFKRALAIRERAISRQSSAVAVTWSYLAKLYVAQSKLNDAELCYRRAIGIQQLATSPEDPQLIPLLRSYAGLLRRLNQESAAKFLEASAEAIRKQHEAKTPPK